MSASTPHLHPERVLLAAALALAACADAPPGGDGDDTTSAATTSAATGATTGPEPTGTTAGSTSSDGSETGASSTGQPSDEVVHVQLLALNDLHGNLEPPQGSAGTIKLPDDTAVETGGAAHLAARVAALRAENPNTVVVSAGDLIGASPLMSALFHDEPTIEVMNQIGLAYNAVGNHEFDDGKDELLRMQAGGCHADGCGDDTPFPGASFQFLAANVLTSAEPTETLFPSYVVHEVGGARIGFIGMTLEGTPAIVTPAGVEGLTFVDEADRANALVPELLGEGVSAIVLLIHEGGYPTGFYDECPELSGPIVEIVERLDPEIDVVVSGHTHQAYNCVIADRLVTSAASFGRVLTDIDLEISVATGDVTAATAKNVLVTRDDADPDVAAFVAMYKDLAAPLANKPIGEISATLERYPPMMKPGLSTMGAVIADAQLAATADVMLGGAQIAFMNPGGVRADLVYEAAPEEAADGIVTYGEAFTVQPFGNSLVVMTLTGAQIEALLEQQFVEGFDPKILQVSAGFTYTYSEGAPVGDKIEPSSILLDGEVVDPAQSYRVTVNSFMASGGDGFTVLVEGADRLGGANDLDALADYFATTSPVDPPALDRITVVP
jgi:5'-nucleotidase